MSPTKLFALAACLCVACFAPVGCTPTTGGDGSGDGSGDMNTNGADDGDSGDGMDGNTAQGTPTAKSTTQAVLSVVIARNEDIRSSSGALRVRSAGEVACPFGGTRSVGANDLIQFNNCAIFPGVPMTGGVQVTPGPEGTQGGRVNFTNLSVGEEDDTFMIDGSLEEIENPDGSLTFIADARTVSIGDSDTDIFNLSGEVTVDEDGLMEGGMNVTGGDLNNALENECDFNGVNIFAFENDPAAIEAACGFDEEDPDFPEQSCDCPEGQDCLPIEGDDGEFFDLCNNCETDEDCLESGLGNECAFGFGCMMFECFSNADCDPGFECVSTVTRGGDCEPL